MPKDDPLIDTVAAAKLRGVSAQQVRNWIKGGKLPYTRIGDVYAVRKSDVMKFKRSGPGRKPAK